MKDCELFKGDKVIARCLFYMGLVIPVAFALVFMFMYVPALAAIWLDKVRVLEPITVLIGTLFSGVMFTIFWHMSAAYGTTVRIGDGRVTVTEWYGRAWEFDLVEPVKISRVAYLFGRVRLGSLLGDSTRSLRSRSHVVYVFLGEDHPESLADCLQRQVTSNTAHG